MLDVGLEHIKKINLWRCKMNLYDMIMTPLEKRVLGSIRAQLLAHACGDVLEIGVGTGVNLSYYNSGQLHSLTGVDLKLSSEIQRYSDEITLIQGSAEALSFADNSFDTVTETLLLRSVMAVSKSLMEIKRVLKPGGKFLWLEHVRPEESKLARAFDRVNWLWEKCTGGCNINRRAVEFVSHAGFQSCIEKTAGKGIFRYGICQKAQ